MQISSASSASASLVDGKREIICSKCHIRFNDVINYKLHLTTEFHIYNVKRNIAQLAPISEDIFEQKKKSLVSADQSALSEYSHKCQPCNKTFKSNLKMDEHKLTKKHKKNEKEYIIANPTANESSIFTSISHGDVLNGSVTVSNNGNMLDELKTSNQIDSTMKDATTEEEKLTVEEDTPDALKVQRKTALESVRCCQFCNKEFDGVKKCLDHMRIKHSFVILDVDCLVDLKGLLTYIAERVHLGQLCLFCSKQFRDPTRCKQHMIDKRHCIMNMDDEDEFVDFYDFTKTYENHPLLINKGSDDIKAIKEEKGDGTDAEGEAWEDVDAEDIESAEEVSDEDTAIAKDIEKPSQSDSEFSIISGKEGCTESFSLVDKPQTSAGQTESEQLFAVESVSSIKSKKAAAKGNGKTREDHFLGLSIKKAELMPTGEVRLGNGKIMGLRKWHYIYKQKPRLPDQRECVIINKLSLQYRQIRAL